MRSLRLSKSRITAGLQYCRRLWWAVHRPRREVHSADAGRRFTVGDGVWEIARQLLRPGTPIRDGSLRNALHDTATGLAAAGDVTLLKTAFRHRSVLVCSNVLARRDGTWRMIEVKSAMRGAEALIAALGTRGPVFVYHDAEKWRLPEIARMFPILRPHWRGSAGALTDLLRLSHGHYHHPLLGGSCR